MPFAMFLDARYGNRTTGIAIHGAPPGSEAKLGRRASPSFAWDPERSRTSAAGALKRKLDGNIATKRGFKALVVIVDARD